LDAWTDPVETGPQYWIIDGINVDKHYAPARSRDPGMTTGAHFRVQNLEVKRTPYYAHSIGFSGRQIASDGEGSSTLDFPLIHDAWSQDQP
jgi:hypothetical protein